MYNFTKSQHTTTTKNIEAWENADIYFGFSLG
jgi:hypothetical protein